ncbi:MAG: AsmA-like C-terminal region-containing protein [Rickettsiales bacterium]
MALKHKNKIKVLAIILLIITGIFEATFFYVSNLIKPEYYQEQVLEAIKKQTGQTIKINGGSRFSLLPSPRLVFSDLEVDVTASTTPSSPTFSIKSVEIHIETASILSRQMRISHVSLINPVLSVERASDNIVHWDWLNLKLLKLLDSGKGVSLPMSIVDGTFSYTDAINRKNIIIEDIDAATNYGTKISLNGSMESNGNPYNFVIDSKAMDLNIGANQFPLNISVSDSNNNTLSVQSVIDASADLPIVTGKFDANSNDLENFLQGVDGEDDDDANHIVMSVTINGKWELQQGILQMHDVTVKGLNSEGKGEASISWDNWYPTVSVNMDFDSIDYLMLRTLSQVKITKKTIKKPDLFLPEYNQDIDIYKDNPLPENIELKLNVRAEKIVSGSEEWKNLNLNAVLDKGALTINQCDIYLNGEGMLTLFGVISQGGNGDLRFEGNIEAKGKSLRDAITMLYPSATDLPEVGTGEFTISANLYINKSQIRLFEADAVVNGTPILGTMTAYLEPELRLEAKIRLKDINFDRIRDMLREKNVEAEKKRRSGERDEIQPKVAGFDWLKNLSTRLDATVYIDNFQFMEREGDRVSFSLYAYNGDLRISNMQLTYSDGISELNATINVKNSIPNISLMLNADQINTSYFNLDHNTDTKTTGNANNKIHKKSAGKFSELRDMSEDTAIPVGWMDSFNGVFDITLRKLIHDNILIEKIKFRGKVDSKQLDIQRLSFVYSQAQSNVTGILYGGKIPGINVSFTMSNADIYEMLYPLTTIRNINGFASLSGVITTNGWSFYEWLNHMDAKLLIAARGVKVKGINLAGVSNVIEVARTSADVFNNVNNVLTNGTTEFLVDGSLNIKDGELRSPNLNIRSGLVTGSIVGGTKLETLEGQFSILFHFGNLLSDVTPTMIIQLSGKVDKPDIKVDTASLEDYVARRNVTK